MNIFRISEKHGTCSYPIIQDEYSYFSTALHLYSTYNVTVSRATMFMYLSNLCFAPSIDMQDYVLYISCCISDTTDERKMILFLTFASCTHQAMLASCKVDVDGGKYQMTDAVAAIRSSFGASPLLLCDGESLQELRLCFDKDLKVILRSTPSLSSTKFF